MNYKKYKGMKMKRIILACVAMMAIGTTTMAQPDQPPRGKPNKKEMVQHRTEEMVKKYGLNAAQQKKLLALNTKYADKMKPMGGKPPRHQGPKPDNGMRRDSMRRTHPEGAFKPGDNERRRPEMTEEQRAKMEQHRKEHQAVMEAYDKELKGIMTAEQFAKYKADAKKRPEGGPRGPKHPKKK